MSNLTAYEPRKVVIKSRGRIFGRKESTDEILQEIVKLALEGHKMKKIKEITGKGRTMIYMYLKKAEELKLIQKTDTGRVKLSNQAEVARQHEMMSKDDFLTKYPCVKSWFEAKIAETKGIPSKVARYKQQLSRLKTICDTLELNPYSILSNQNGLAYGGAKAALTAFSNAMINDKVKYASKSGRRSNSPDISTKFREYSQVIRSFCAGNGILIPERIEGILSGKKVSYGKYAYIKLSFEKIDECVRLLGEKYGYASREQALFVFYYLTCARKQAGLDVKAHTVTHHQSGWITCRVHESKTGHTWTKYIPNDNPHQQIFLDYMEKRDGCKYLFGDSEEELNKTYSELPPKFGEIYRMADIKEEYFYIKQVHALRHVGAHYWLNRTNYNHVIVSRIGGWKSVQTLIDCYGQPDEDYIIKFLTDDHVGL